MKVYKFFKIPQTDDKDDILRPVPVDLHVNKENLDKEFDCLTKDLSEEDKCELSRRVNMKAIMYEKKRMGNNE